MDAVKDPIDGEQVFTKADAEHILKRLFDEQATEFEVEFAPEKWLTAGQLRKALLEHDHDLYLDESSETVVVVVVHRI